MRPLMAIFPSAVEARAFEGLDAVVAWTGLRAEAWAAVDTLLGGCNGRTRNLALISAAALRAAASTAEAIPARGGDATALSPMDVALVGLVWRICRRLAFTEAGGAWADFVDVDPTITPPTSSALALLPSAPSVSTPMGPSVRKLKLSALLDQGDDTEIQAAPPGQIESWFQNYTTALGAPPQEEEEPTAEQLQALHHRVFVAQGTPYADFAVWGPFGRKAARASKLRAWLPLPDGRYLVRELPGPDGWAQWLTCWRVFAAAAVMLAVSTLASLQLYERTVERLSRMWPQAWHLIAIADDKCRAEHLERIRRRTQAEVARGGVAPSDWDATAPWTCCLRCASSDTVFWDEQVRHPAAAWMAAGGRGIPKAPEEEFAAAAIPGGIAAVRPETEAARARQRDSRDADPVTRKSRKTRRGAGPPATAPRVHTPPPIAAGRGLAKSGKGRGRGAKVRQHTVDQSGVAICFSWDDGVGACGVLAAGAACPAGRVHKCSKCLSPAHRAADCPGG